MRTALSSAAAPGASLEELLAGLARHGLAALELRVGDAHAIHSSTPPSALAEARRMLARAGVQVTGLLDADGSAPAPEACRALGTRWLIGADLPLHTRLERADWARTTGLPVAVVVGGADAPAETHEVRQAGHAVVWEAHPAHAPLEPLCDGVMVACAGHLTGVRLCGGGPEGSLHEGRGIGWVMTRLTLAGFDGALTLAPSDRRYHMVWSSWLGRHSGWGCGSKVAEPAARRRPLPMMEASHE